MPIPGYSRVPLLVFPEGFLQAGGGGAVGIKLAIQYNDPFLLGPSDSPCTRTEGPVFWTYSLFKSPSLGTGG